MRFIECASLDDLDGLDQTFLLVSSVGCSACEGIEQDLMSLNLSGWIRELHKLKITSIPDQIDLVRALGIKMMPTLIHYEGGEEQQRWGGYFDDMAVKEKRALLQNLLNSYFEGRE